MPRKVYISGPIKNNPDYLRHFQAAEHKLRLRDGFETVNPCTIHDDEKEMTYEDFMRDDLKALLDCNSIYMLYGWEKSVGARLEHSVAAICGMKIMYESEPYHGT